MNLEDRISRLELDARRWRIAALSLAVAAVLALSCQQHSGTTSAYAAKPADVTSFDTISVRRLQITSDEGQERGYFQALEDGAIFQLQTPGDEKIVRITNALGSNSITLRTASAAVTTDGAGIHIARLDAAELAESKRLSKTISKNSVAENQRIIALLQGKPMIELTRSDDHQSGILNIYNALGKQAVSIQANKGNKGAVYVYDFDGKLKKFLVGE